MKTLILNKKAQIGQTLTWAVATLIIIGILILSIIFSSVLAGTKHITGEKGEVKSGLTTTSAVLNMKTTLAYELNSANKKEIEKILKEEKS